jgi:dihydroxy-acid dehydratase
MSTMKPRSGLVTDGLERAPARGMLRAVGMGDEDWVKPQIGVVSSWNEITPCNLSLARLATASRKGVIDAGGFPMQWAMKECTSHWSHAKLLPTLLRQ